LSSKARVLKKLVEGLARHGDVILLRAVPAALAAAVIWELAQVILGAGSKATLIDGLWTLLVAVVVFELTIYRYLTSPNRRSLSTVVMRLFQALIALGTALLILAPELAAFGVAPAVAKKFGGGGNWQSILAHGATYTLLIEFVIHRMRLDAANVASAVLRVVQVVGIISEADLGHWLGAALIGLLFEGIIFRLRPDPRPPVLEDALRRIQQEVAVYTQLPIEKVKETLGMVRGISDIQADSGLEFELAEQEALYLMLKQAKQMGANAVVDARLSIGTYEVTGAKWQVSRPVYTGTAVRI
jgi:uncharacterized protein YbjQ (UPF0145 family)